MRASATKVQLESKAGDGAVARPPKNAARLVGLDFTKGILVLMMVLYHWLNYFVQMEGFYYRYIRFLTPSFIFITGFLISHVYLSKYGAEDSRLPSRLVVRGLKLIGVFIGLNGIMAVASRGGFGVLADWSVYTGSGRAAFSVLLPIGYLLIASAAVSLAARVHSGVFTAAAVMGVTAVIAMQYVGVSNAFVELISIGLIGITVGRIAIGKIEFVIRNSVVLGMAYVVYLGAITLWNELYVLQIVGVSLTLAIIYRVGSRADNGSGRPVVFLGRYSLIGYIAQIAILQLLRRLARHVGENAAMAAAWLVLGAVLTYFAVLAVDRARVNSPLTKKLYSAVFA